MWYVNPTDQVWDKDKSRIVRCSFQCLMPDLRLILCRVKKNGFAICIFFDSNKICDNSKNICEKTNSEVPEETELSLMTSCHTILFSFFLFSFFLFFFFSFLHLACCICSCWPIIANEFNSLNERHGPVLQFLT